MEQGLFLSKHTERIEVSIELYGKLVRLAYCKMLNVCHSACNRLNAVIIIVINANSKMVNTNDAIIILTNHIYLILDG